MPRTFSVLFAGAFVCLLAVAGQAAPAVHRVERGETLHRISRRHGVTVDQIKSWNSLRNNLIYPGQALVVAAPDTARAPAPALTLPAQVPTPLAQVPTPEYMEHQVRKGDTLASIALRHEVSVAFLQQLNGIKGSRIYPGQALKVRPMPASPLASASVDPAPQQPKPPPPESTYEVRRGDTLSKIAQRYGTTPRELGARNGLTSTRIYPGQKLRIPSSSPSRASKPTFSTHVVQRGEFLSKIAGRYGMQTAELKRLNDLRSDRIHPGQTLKVVTTSKLRTRIYVVQRGDNLSDIAARHGMTLAELRSGNALRGSMIHPGQKLRIHDALEPAGGWIEIADIDWESLAAAPAGVRTIVVENGPYFSRGPKAGEQRSKSYFEGSPDGPLATYRRASKLWKEFEIKVDRMGRISRHLEGWHIVLDPGHGGQDPGTIVKSLDGNGDTLYVVEDEYVHDIALRMYVLLRLHGAEVTMTVLSPNHLIRRSEQPTRTFVHEKNEVYNSYACNESNSSKAWPRGRYDGLKPRVEITRAAVQNVPPHQTIFMSLHADNSPKSPITPSVLYYSRYGKDDGRSKRFAERLRPVLGPGTTARGQRLAVLKDNPAYVKVLVEVRNLAYRDNVWALRVEALRQQDAEKLVAGILDYAGSATVVSR